MLIGLVINTTEKRQVGHPRLRAIKAEPEIQAVKDRIKDFSNRVRSGEIKGHTGKNINTIVAIGIGGSYLGPEFVYEALRFYENGEANKGMNLRFLANVDPIDFARASAGLDIEQTLFVIVSKTFTTAETMLNARTCRSAIVDYYKGKDANADEKAALKAHLCAVSTNLTATEQFGISNENVFGFWDWVGGRFSVSSAVGLLPLSLYFGYDLMDEFLSGLASVDDRLNDTGLTTQNAPVMLGLIGFYTSYIEGIESRAILPYCQALLRFPAHIQQL